MFILCVVCFQDMSSPDFMLLSDHRIINKFLEKKCFVGYIADVTNPPPSDAFLRKVAVDAQVPRINQ